MNANIVHALAVAILANCAFASPERYEVQEDGEPIEAFSSMEEAEDCCAFLKEDGWEYKGEDYDPTHLSVVDTMGYYPTPLAPTDEIPF